MSGSAIEREIRGYPKGALVQAIVSLAEAGLLRDALLHDVRFFAAAEAMATKAKLVPEIRKLKRHMDRMKQYGPRWRKRVKEWNSMVGRAHGAARLLKKIETEHPDIAAVLDEVFGKGEGKGE